MLVNPSREQIEVLNSLELLVREALDGGITGLSYTVTTPSGIKAGWAGNFSGRRLTLVDETRRIVLVDDPHADLANRVGAER